MDLDQQAQDVGVNENQLQGDHFFAQIGAKKEIDDDTSETSSYKSSKGDQEQDGVADIQEI